MAQKGEFEFPLRVITRKGEKYVYVGDLPNTANARENARDMGRQSGRKSIIITDPHDKRTAVHYISSKFYNSVHVTLYPIWGKGKLVGG